MITGSCAVITGTDVLHDALDRLAGYDYLDGAGFPCHGSMGAGALSALGLDDEVPGWVDAYVSRHAPIAAPPPTGRRIDPVDEPSWRPALGDFSRVADWAAMFREMLWDEPWPVVLRRWAPRLLPGYGGGLTHGLLRTAHAVQAMPIENRDTHVLELTEACAREHALNPDPVYLYAAHHLLAHTPPW